MKPCDEMSSLRGANTLLQGQQKIKTEEDSSTADKSSRSNERPTEMREGHIKGDQRTRAEEPGPLRNATSEGQSTL
jgi:hypothetical protein